ncbi:anaphase-promoting complex subunit 5-domain-containing protein [Chaetomium tenue]|uniref:Anaphase-promoting complex subunit 5-domain-containing protein n=1 Tax=Chaetomium tenue TaxID=1854479 RepID=A0ACB7P438_9PEZI|nr:anaphase-promoting complex subunit 5-domain-containing protein [Chaetomium globosum]
MSRYLAPSKIGLLALIELYIEGAVPNDATIPVINFLTSHLLDYSLTGPFTAPTERWKEAENTIRLAVSVHHFEELLAPFAAVDRLPGRSLWDRFLEKLWGIDSLHTLHEFFDQLPNHLARTKAELRELASRGEEPPSGVLLTRNSPFGVFIRKAHLEYTRLYFDYVANLWKTFVKYRQPTAAYWRRRNPHHSRLSFDSVLLEGEHEWGLQTDGIAVAAYGNMLLMDGQDAELPVSTDDIESLLEFQIEQVQKYGTRVPPKIREQFQKLVKSSRIVPSLSHYLNFSDSWRSGEFPAAFDHLHRYFDYTMQNRDRLFYQYALLNLGIVQSDFGCHKEAVATMLEAISTAKENQDTTCLNFALNWFFHFGRAHPNLVKELEDNSMLGSGKELLAFLRAKAKETGMWILWSSALLSEAKMGLANGESISVAVESMVRSSQVIVEKNVKAMMGPQLSLGIALWDRLGMAAMSNMTCEVFLRCYVHSSVFDDELKLSCRMAGMLAGKGQYEDAYAKLESIDTNSLRSAKPDQYWHLYRGLLKLRRDLHHNNLDSAEALLSQLLQNSSEDIESDIVFFIDTLHIEALMRRNDFDAAFTKVDRLISELRESDRDSSLRIRLLLIKIQLFDRIGRPEKGFTLAMRAASMAWRARLLALLWQAVGALANILNALGEFAAADRLLVAVIPRCLETDVTYTAGNLYNILADARVGLAGEMKKGRSGGLSLERARVMAMAHEALDGAFCCFEAVEDVVGRCEVMAKKATLFRVEGDLARADECADAYLRARDEDQARKG